MKRRVTVTASPLEPRKSKRQKAVKHDDDTATSQDARTEAAAAASGGPLDNLHESVDPAEDDADSSDDEDPAGEPSRPDIDTAAVQLVKLTGLSQEAALNALKETQESVFNAAGSGAENTLLEAWLEEAQIWLACNLEVQVEIEEVRTAMQESLQEYEAAKAADDLPLTERPADYLRARFEPATACSSSRAYGATDSIVFRHITAFTCHRALFAAGAHKAPLVKLIELECKCHRWYPCKGTVKFWEQLAEGCAAAAAGAAGPTAALKAEGWACCDQGPDGCSFCAAAVGRDEAGAGPSTSAAPPTTTPRRSAVSAAARSAVLVAVGAFAACKGPEVEREICKMPTVTGQMPDVFAALNDPPGVDADSDVECIELVESASDGGQGDEL